MYNFSQKKTVLFVGSKNQTQIDVLNKNISNFTFQGCDSEIVAALVKKERFDIILSSSYDFCPDNSMGSLNILLDDNISDVDSIIENKKILKKYHAIAASVPEQYENYIKAEVSCIQIAEGINLNVFGHDRKFISRKFRVLVVSNSGQKTKINDLLNNFDDIEVINFSYHDLNEKSNEELNLIYNTCKIVVFLETHENRPITLLEVVACGCIVLTKKHGFASILDNKIIFENEYEIFSNIINMKNNKDLAWQTSIRLSKEALKFDEKKTYYELELFMQNKLIKKQGLI